MDQTPQPSPDPAGPQHPVPTPTPGATASPPLTRPKHSILKLLLLGLFIAFGTIILVVAVGFVMLGFGLQAVSSGCTQTEKTTAQNVATIRSETGRLRISGQAPDTFGASSTGDCLTNGTSRATGTADFSAAAPDVVTANAEVLQSLQLQPPYPQIFELTDTSDVVTQLTGGSGRYFEVEYDFTDKPDCLQAFPGLCYYHPITSPQLFAGRPISRIVVQLQNVPFSPLPQ